MHIQKQLALIAAELAETLLERDPLATEDSLRLGRLIGDHLDDVVGENPAITPTLVAKPGENLEPGNTERPRPKVSTFLKLFKLRPQNDGHILHQVVDVGPGRNQSPDVSTDRGLVGSEQPEKPVMVVSASRRRPRNEGSSSAAAVTILPRVERVHSGHSAVVTIESWTRVSHAAFNLQNCAEINANCERPIKK
jgi:hypothetical protein